MSRTLAAALLSGLLAPLASGQVGMAVNDLFNRPNSSDLGPDWIEVEPFADARIQSNRLLADNPGVFGWVAHTAFSELWLMTVVQVDWAFSGPGDRISAIAGADPSTWGAIEARVGDNTGDGRADRIWFNSAVNAGNWGSTGRPVSYDLATPISAGTLTLYFTNNGDTAVAEVRDAATGTTETFTAGGIRGFQYLPTGLSVGIGHLGRATADDFRAWTGAPTGPAYTMTTPRANQSATFLVTDAAPRGAVALLLSVTGPGPLPSPWGTIGMSPPIYNLATLPTDANGSAVLRLPSVPPSLTGATMYSQAFDGLGLQLSNPFWTTFQ